MVLTQMPTQIPKPTYEIQRSTAAMDAIPKTSIKAPNTICAMAKPRKEDARYAMLNLGGNWSPRQMASRVRDVISVTELCLARKIKNTVKPRNFELV